MIHITTHTPSELVGCRGFKFRAQLHYTHNYDLVFGGEAEKLNQLQAIGRVIATIETLKNYPCPCNLTVGIQHGQVVMDGALAPYERKAAEAAQTTLPQVNQLLARFREHYEGSSFTVTAKIEITITDTST